MSEKAETSLNAKNREDTAERSKKRSIQNRRGAATVYPSDAVFRARFRKNF